MVETFGLPICCFKHPDQVYLQPPRYEQPPCKGQDSLSPCVSTTGRFHCIPVTKILFCFKYYPNKLKLCACKILNSAVQCFGERQWVVGSFHTATGMSGSDTKKQAECPSRQHSGKHLRSWYHIYPKERTTWLVLAASIFRGTRCFPLHSARQLTQTVRFHHVSST